MTPWRRGWGRKQGKAERAAGGRGQTAAATAAAAGEEASAVGAEAPRPLSRRAALPCFLPWRWLEEQTYY